MCSADSGIPLVRYDLKDNGGIIKMSSVVDAFNARDIKLTEQSLNNEDIWNLPFVYVYERDDFSVSFYAFQIYPGTIKKALQHTIFEHELTGKFTMLVEYDEEFNQILEINVELKYGMKDSEDLGKKIQNQIKTTLMEESSEYRETYRHKGDLVLPRIILHEYENPEYFKPGIKQKWVKK